MSKTGTKQLRDLFDRMCVYGDVHFDPDWALLRLPANDNVHTEHLPKNTKRHPIRESLYYALVLLERGDLERAQSILQKVISCQAAGEPGDFRYGLWNYFAEESVEDWPLPDLNWADFNAMTLLMIWHSQREKLDKTTLNLLCEAIGRAAICIRRRNVAMGYTNIAIKGTFVTLAGAELLGDADLMAYAVDRAQRLHAEVFKTSSFTEYNSPTYAKVSLTGLMAIDNFVRHEPSRKLCREIQGKLWMNIARHFHMPTKELAGPHSRVYSVRSNGMQPMLGIMLAKATGLDFDLPQNLNTEDFGAFYGYFLDPALPKEALDLFLDKMRTETIVETVDPRNKTYDWWRPVAPPDTRDGSTSIAEPIPARITTHLNPNFCLGSVNLMDGWEQRQNLIGYWKNGQGQVGYLRQRYLHDKRPCCSGYFASAQDEGRVLAANFLTQYCDHHVSIPADEISVEFLGSVIEIQNEGEKFDLWLEEKALAPNQSISVNWNLGQHLWLRLPTVWIAVRLLAHEAYPLSDINPKLDFDGSRLEVSLPHYSGLRKTLRWTDLELTHTSFLLWMTAPKGAWEDWKAGILSQTAVVLKNADIIEVKSGELRLVVPGRTIPRENLPSIVAA